MFRRNIVPASILSVFFLAGAAGLYAQMTVTGSISGAVTDPSGQMVPGGRRHHPQREHRGDEVGNDK